MGAVIAACGLSWVSREQAISIALANTDLTEARVHDVYQTTSSFGEDVWVVIVRGNWLTCDGPGVPGTPESLPCRTLFAQADEHVDSKTGGYAGGTITAPVEP